MKPCDLPLSSGIYQIINLQNGKFYIGSTRKLRTRLREHFSDLRTGRHHSAPLQRAWNKYGEAAFSVKVLEHVEDLSQLIVREQAAFDSLSPEYNACKTAGSSLGRPCPDSVKSTLSRLLKGRVFSEETRRRISEGVRAHLAPSEKRQAISQRQTGRRMSEETRQKMSEAAQGRSGAKWTEERREKTSASLKLAKSRPESKARLAERNRKLARFSDDQIRSIRSAYADGVKQGILAEQYGVTVGPINAIINRRSYAHVADL